MKSIIIRCLLFAVMMAVVVPSAYSQTGHYRPPVFVEKPDIIVGSHCDALTAQVRAKSRMLIPDYRIFTAIRYTLDSGPGSVDPVTGLWTYNPSIIDAGDTQTVIISAHQGSMQTTGNDRCQFKVYVTNYSPRILMDLNECGAGFSFPSSVKWSKWVRAYDADYCDRVSIHIASVEPEPVGQIYFNAGWLTFEADARDAGKRFHVVIAASDGKATTYCDLYFEPQAVIPPVPLAISIEKTINTYQGSSENIDITLDSGHVLLNGFDMLIGYNADAFAFQFADESELFYSDSAGCGWEYFTYRYGPTSPCDSTCPSGLLRIVGIAEINNGQNHPACYFPDSLPATIFTLHFLVSNDRQYECQFFPIRFFWLDCGDNSLATINSDSLLLSRNVYDYDSTIISSSDSFPTYFGAQDECLFNDVGYGVDYIRFIDFYNGGIEIACVDSIALIGDLNLDGVPYQIADAVLYSNYFVHGLAVFTINQQTQVAASDVNLDGVPLTIEDLTYMIRVIVGDALPYPQNLPQGEVDVSVNAGVVNITTDDSLATANIILEGNAYPVLLKDNMDMKFAYDQPEDITRVLIYSMEANSFFESGQLVNIGENNLISASFATYDGGKVVTTISSTNNVAADDFTVFQNYPNPFNNETVINFNLPTAGPVTFEVYNILGRIVYSHKADYSAGNNQIAWGGVNNSGVSVASGIYYYSIKTNDNSLTKKMLILK